MIRNVPCFKTIHHLSAIALGMLPGTVVLVSVTRFLSGNTGGRGLGGFGGFGGFSLGDSFVRSR